MTKHNQKMINSFTTKLRLFIFTKAFSENLEEYLGSSNYERIKKDFEEFNKYILTIELTKKFSNEYFQSKKEKIISIMIDNHEVSKTQKELEDNLKFKNYAYFSQKAQQTLIDKKLYNELKSIYEESFREIFDQKDFEALISVNTCAYCGITKEQIELLRDNGSIASKSGRGASLEVDRKFPNLEYSVNNCCMACYWCNNAKTDEYTPLEFKSIAKGINKIWNKRLQRIDINQYVCFPKKSHIWKEKFCTTKDNIE